MKGSNQATGPRVAPLLTVALVVAGLYFAREFLLPLALSILISFLLAPLIRRFERWHMGRILSVLTATALAFLVIGLIGYVIVGQLIDLGYKLPDYKSNLLAKVSSIKSGKNSPLTKATETMRDLSDAIAKEDTEAAAPGAQPEKADPADPPRDEAAPSDPAATPEPGAGAEKAEEKNKAPPVPVAVVENNSNPLETLRTFVTPLLGPLGTAAIVIIFVVFMLLEREDLRDRMIHLVGRGRLYVTTQALDDAARRVSRYLLAQLIVNVSYGVPVAVGLAIIGIPNAVLWGFLATLLRFVPYIGPWIAAAFPIALSLAVSPSWSAPLYTLALFVVIELISNNVVEPWLYGSSTGLSPMAVIVSAVFWTWLWGTVGLLLATPLTVCIAVLGKHIPSLAFLDVLLGDKPPIATEDRFYQRLLAGDAEEALAIVEECAAEHGLVAASDDLLLPALRLIESDFRDNSIDESTRHEMYRVLRQLIGELGETAPVLPESATVLCLPASNEGDEMASLILARLLSESGVRAHALSSKLMTNELVEYAAGAKPPLICISVVPACSLISSVHLCKKLRERLDSSMLVVGLWGEKPGEDDRRLQRLKRAHADHVFTRLAEAIAEIRAQPSVGQTVPVLASKTEAELALA
jgi:predicted PurR-regulated permease PerM/methylmalonyl-CoA mutase cobalamin-binding subunit